MRRLGLLWAFLYVLGLVVGTFGYQLATAPLAEASAGIVQVGNGSASGNSVTVTLGSTPVYGDTLVVFCVGRGGSGTPTNTLTDNKGQNAYSQRKGFAPNSTINAYIAWTGALANVGSSFQITAGCGNASTPNTFTTVWYAEVSDTLNAATWDSSGTSAQGTSTAPQATFTTTAANTLVLALAANGDTSSSTTWTQPGGSWTDRGHIANASAAVASGLVSQAFSSVQTGTTATWTTGSFAWGASSVDLAVTGSVTSVAVNDANVYWSPYTWLCSGSAWCRANSPGSYVKFGFTGTSLTVLWDISPLTAASANALDYPNIYYSIDGATLKTLTLTSGTVSSQLATGLSAGTHYAWISYKGLSGTPSQNPPQLDRWNTPSMVVKILGFGLDASSATATISGAPWYPLRPNVCLFYGYSNLEGIYADYPATPVTNTGDNSLLTWATTVAAGENCEYGQVGYGSQAWTGTTPTSNSVPGLRGTTSADTTWDKYDANDSRLVGGVLSPTPTIIVAMMGANDYAQSRTDASITTATQSFLNDLNTDEPNTPVYYFATFGLGRTQLIADMSCAAVTCYQQDHFIDLGAELAQGLSGGGQSDWKSPDGLHCNPECHMMAAGLVMQAIQAQSVGSLPVHNPVLGGGGAY